MYSTDGGLSFPNTLVTNVPNDGSHDITVPNVSSSQVRFMVICSDNIFFDISDVNISIGVVTVCTEFTSTDVPVAISSSGSPTVTSNLAIPTAEDVVDINVLGLEGTHTYLGDLTFTLINPMGTEVVLVSGECGTNEDFNINFDDAGGALPCPYNDNSTVAPSGSLTDFNGTEPSGNWILEIADGANQDGGQLTAWTVEVCYEEAIPLPVELISFEAKANKKSIQLDWKTANEIDNLGFEIQRSIAANKDFEKIGWVDGSGTASAGRYQFEDQEAIAGIDYYYRLKQIDFDRQHSFSPIRTAQIAGGDLLSMQLAPNPVKDQLNISFSGKGSISGEVLLVNAVGKVIQQFSFEGRDLHQQQLEVSSLSAGVYFLKVVNEERLLVVERFLKE